MPHPIASHPAARSRPRHLLITGPTASGKTAYAQARARDCESLIINADSMQVYRDLQILSARPSPADEAGIPHALYGHVDGAQAYSAGRFVAEVAELIARCEAEGLRAMIVGGTGLYFSALTEGLSPVPAIPDEVRRYWRAEADRIGGPALHKVLADLDPEMAAHLRPSDPQRVTRALEVLAATGHSLAHWQRDKGCPVLLAEACECIALMPSRAVVCARADMRFDQMMAAGALGEVEALAARGLDPALPVMRALGVPPLLDALAGRSAMEDAVDAAKVQTRQYIKRQMTWVRRQFPTWQGIPT